MAVQNVNTMQQEEELLYPLRADLQLLQGPRLSGGSPSWTLHDPVRNRFYRIGPLEFAIISRWSTREQPISASALTEEVRRRTTLPASEEDVRLVQSFLAANCLLAPGAPQSAPIIKRNLRQRTNWLTWFIHHYLFFRVPLVRPDALLEKTLPLARLLISIFNKKVLAMGLFLGGYLVMRNWEAFIHSFLYFFTPEGFFFYGCAIIFVKILHEFGHVYTAKYYGLKVPAIGVAFIVLWPMLYSDTTDSWKLPDRKARMKIVAGGMLTEIALAILATILWHFLPEGPAKSACYIVATSSWLMSLLFNLSPFMRFDGYYLLSDYLDVPNLQDRAFALAKQALRQIIFGWPAPYDDPLPPQKRRLLILYAYATWCYRLMIFTSIALAVYHLFFKALGIILFGIEICWFILLPVSKEMRLWRHTMATAGFCARNLLGAMGLIGLLLALFFFPWKTTISTPAFIHSANYAHVYPHMPARIDAVYTANNRQVEKNELLFTLSDPWLDHRLELLSQQIRALEKQLSRQITDTGLLEPKTILEQRLSGFKTELDGIKEKQTLLEIRARISGLVVDFNEDVYEGMWVNESNRLLTIIDPERVKIETYLDEEALSRIDINHSGSFYGENGQVQALDCRVAAMEKNRLSAFSEPYLASTYGGALAASYSSKQKLIVPRKTLYRVELLPNASRFDLSRIVRGTVRIHGRPQSFYQSFRKQVLAVLIKESGF